MTNVERSSFKDLHLLSILEYTLEKDRIRVLNAKSPLATVAPLQDTGEIPGETSD